MNHKPNILAIIPARGGSKGIPGKNIKLVAGRPLIDYTIDIALQSTMLNKTIVSSDDDKILEFVKNKTVDVIIRPPEYATDTSNVVDTALHAVESLKEQGDFFDYVVLLQPTAPLRLVKDIDTALKNLIDSSADALISVVEVGDNHPSRMYEVDDHLKLNSFMGIGETRRRQDLSQLYLRNGALYIIKTDVLFKEKTFMPENKIAYIMDKRWAVNIDEELDLEVLEIVLKKWNEIYGDFNNRT